MNWRYKIDLNQVIAELMDDYDLTCMEEDCPPEVKERLIAEISKATPLLRFIDQLQEVKSIAAVNRVLSDVYDEADVSKVWCGLP
jgi:hypothetical protein